MTTPFGPLRLRSDHVAPSNGERAVALVRPEQMHLSTVIRGAGLPATVVRTQFHGHDTVITVSPHAPLEPPTPLTVRAEGSLLVADGTEVEITADGSALAWPASSDARPAGSPDARPADSPDAEPTPISR